MFDSIAQLVTQASESGGPLHEIVIQAEMANTGKPREYLLSRMAKRLEIMQRAASLGIAEPVMSISGISGAGSNRRTSP